MVKHTQRVCTKTVKKYSIEKACSVRVVEIEFLTFVPFQKGDRSLHISKMFGQYYIPHQPTDWVQCDSCDVVVHGTTVIGSARAIATRQGWNCDALANHDICLACRTRRAAPVHVTARVVPPMQPVRVAAQGSVSCDHFGCASHVSGTSVMDARINAVLVGWQCDPNTNTDYCPAHVPQRVMVVHALHPWWM